MVAPSVDHLPYTLDGFDRSITVEQRFPLSSVLKHRKEEAEAGFQAAKADTSRTILDVQFDALTAFFMLYERRQSAQILEQQLSLAREVVAAANARYAGATGTQSEVLRAEVDVAQLEATSSALKGEIRAAEAMLNASLGRATDLPIPALQTDIASLPAPSWADLKTRLPQRPELDAARADIARTAAGIQVMRDMYIPMLTVRAGTAFTMTEGRGAMLMAGVNIPIWRGRLRAGVAEAKAMNEMAKADLGAMTTMVEGQAAQTFNQVQADSTRYRALRDDVLPRARNAIDPTLSSYAAGRLPLVSVLEAVQTYWTTQTQLLEAEVELDMAWARLGRAVGTMEMAAP